MYVNKDLIKTLRKNPDMRCENELFMLRDNNYMIYAISYEKQLLEYYEKNLSNDIYIIEPIYVYYLTLLENLIPLNTYSKFYRKLRIYNQKMIMNNIFIMNNNKLYNKPVILCIKSGKLLDKNILDDIKEEASLTYCLSNKNIVIDELYENGFF